MYKGIDHIALAVNDIEQAAKFYQKAFQLDMIMGLSYPADGVHTNLVLSLGPKNELEFLGPIGDNGFLMNFLNKHGQGVHHMALEVTDIENETRKLKESGIDIFGTTGEKGMQFTFLHPRSTLRLGMQLMQRGPQKFSNNPMIKGIDYIAVRASSMKEGRDFFINKLVAKPITSEKDEIPDCICERFVLGDANFLLFYDLSDSLPIQEIEGLHHVAVKVDNLAYALRHLSRFQVEPLDMCFGKRSVFLPPDKMYGCLWRLIEA